MTVELSKPVRREALASIIRYFKEARDEEIGQIAAGNLLDFVLQEIGPSIYNKAVADILRPPPAAPAAAPAGPAGRSARRPAVR